MQAVILAAGLGTRMGELTKDCPKPLLKIQDLTLLEHNLKSLPPEIDEVVLVVGYLAEKIKHQIGDEFLGKKIVYVQQKELKGTGHALSMCKAALNGRFLVLMGDDLYEKDDLAELARHPLGILVLELDSDELTSDRQALVKVDAQGRLLDIIERQPAHKGMLVNVGAYVLDKRYFDFPLAEAGNKTAEFGLPQTMLQMVKLGAQFDIVKAHWWHKVAGPDDLKI
ncbi:nucleotidyltransferase family protein [bacterium]|nr:MAG: nucleotidyltransferase family protein [bacterium]